MTAVLLLLLAPMVLVPWRQNHAVPWVMGLAGRPAPVAEQVTAARQEAQRAGDVDALGELAMICHANGLYDSAQQCHQQLERRAPQDYRWVYLQVLLAEARAEVEPPVQLLRRTVALNKGYAPAWYRLGQTWFKQGKDQEAARAFERAQSGESGSYAALGLARIRLKQDRPESALRTLQSAVRRRPQFGPVHRMLGQVYGRLGRDEKIGEGRAGAHHARGGRVGSASACTPVYVGQTPIPTKTWRRRAATTAIVSSESFRA